MNREEKLEKFLDRIKANCIAQWGGNPRIERYMAPNGRQFLVERHDSGGWEIYTAACTSNKIDDTFEAVRDQITPRS